MSRLYAIAAAFVALLAFAVPAYAVVNEFPVVNISPGNIPPGGTETIVLSNGAGTPPAYIDGGLCPSGQYAGYLVNYVAVFPPSGGYYLLQTTTKGDPNILVGPGETTSAIVFGPGVGLITFTLASGTYTLEWWHEPGDVAQTPLPSTATDQSGAWNIDVAGNYYCNGGQQGVLNFKSSFDVSHNFTVPEFGLATAVVAALGFAAFAAFRRFKPIPR